MFKNRTERDIRLRHIIVFVDETLAGLAGLAGLEILPPLLRFKKRLAKF